MNFLRLIVLLMLFQTELLHAKSLPQWSIVPTESTFAFSRIMNKAI